MDERATDVMVADERVLELDARLFGEPQRHRVGRVRHREDAVGARGRMLAGELPAEGPADAVHGAVEHGTARPGKVTRREQAAAVRCRTSFGRWSLWRRDRSGAARRW